MCFVLLLYSPVISESNSVLCFYSFCKQNSFPFFFMEKRDIFFPGGCLTGENTPQSR